MRGSNRSIAKRIGIVTNGCSRCYGTGSGYFAFRIADLVKRGQVLAVDIQPEMIKILKK
jgi:tRNA A58 N-methylase Trm61